MGLPADFFLSSEMFCTGAHTPPWELPDYISDLCGCPSRYGAMDCSGGIIEQVWWLPSDSPSPLPPSGGESEVGVSDEGTPFHQTARLRCKVGRGGATLEQGLWAGMGLLDKGWKIFMKAESL